MLEQMPEQMPEIDRLRKKAADEFVRPDNRRTI
jgi:hypothetical protein